MAYGFDFFLNTERKEDQEIDFEAEGGGTKTVPVPEAVRKERATKRQRAFRMAVMNELRSDYLRPALEHMFSQFHEKAEMRLLTKRNLPLHFDIELTMAGVTAVYRYSLTDMAEMHPLDASSSNPAENQPTFQFAHKGSRNERLKAHVTFRRDCYLEEMARACHEFLSAETNASAGYPIGGEELRQEANGNAIFETWEKEGRYTTEEIRKALDHFRAVRGILCVEITAQTHQEIDRIRNEYLYDQSINWKKMWMLGDNDTPERLWLSCNDIAPLTDIPQGKMLKHKKIDKDFTKDKALIYAADFLNKIERQR